MSKLRVTVWHEFVHERVNPEIAAIYPEGMHGAIATALAKNEELLVRTATLQEPEHGLTKEVLAETDVLTWWGHAAHGDVRDDIVDRIQQRVLEGMGLIVLHSAHYSKIFRRLMGTGCELCWREAGERERLWVTSPGHPIAAGIGDCIEIEQSEMYGEPFGIPEPDEQVFISWYEGGEVFRSGNCWRRGNGKIFYFSPGHETYPIYHHPDIQRVIMNAVFWARPQGYWSNKGRPIPLEITKEKIVPKGPRLHDDSGHLIGAG
jgi:trehalose utilization protein